MSSQTAQTNATSPDEMEVRALYLRLIDGWNQRSAADFATLFEDNGNCVGFDGSQLDGREMIQTTLEQIFAHHQTAPYVSKEREIRFLTGEVALLRAVVGMVPRGKTDIDPSLNAIQSLVAVKRNDNWYIALFQNTPAQFHGRPELAQQLTEELRQLRK